MRRLTQVTYPSGSPSSVQYSYDAVGNRLTKTVSGTPTTYSYDAANQLTSAGGVAYNFNGNGAETNIAGAPQQFNIVDYEGNALEVGTCYDLNRDGGDLVNDILSEVQKYFHDEGSSGYDPRFDLAPSNDPDGMIRVADILAVIGTYFADCTSTAHYSYNGDNLLVQKEIASTAFNMLTTNYVYDVGGTDRSTLHQTGIDYIYGPRTASGPEPIEQADGQAYSYLTDGQGSIVEFMLPSGTTKATFQYDAFGDERTKTGSDDSALRFRNRWEDRDVTEKLYRLGTSKYDPATGRLLTASGRSPVAARGVATSAYAQSSPTNIGVGCAASGPTPVPVPTPPQPTPGPPRHGSLWSCMFHCGCPNGLAACGFPRIAVVVGCAGTCVDCAFFSHSPLTCGGCLLCIAGLGYEYVNCLMRCYG